MIASDTHKFQVDLGGVISLLSKNLYSSPGVYVRELLQNSIDALTARDDLDGGRRPIVICPCGVSSPSSPQEEYSIQDSGIGVTLDQVDQFLATVGASSKRTDIEASRHNFIGQFGIGLLSCFLVTDEITVVSKSRHKPPIRWVGSSDGTYTVCALDDDLPIGTTVSFRPRPEATGWARSEQVVSLARKYGEFLPAQVVVHTPAGDQMVTHDFPFADFPAHRARVQTGTVGAVYAGVGIRQQFDAIPVNIASTRTQGIIYLDDVGHGTKRSHPNRIYVNRMLVSDSDRELLPEWAFFAWAVVDSTGLRTTASRETIVDDTALRVTREAIGNAIEDWLADLAENDPGRFQSFVQTHALALREVVGSAPGLASVVIPELLMETTKGPMRIKDIVAYSPTIFYTDSVKNFHRVAMFAPSDRLIVNAGYVHDGHIIEVLPAIFPGTTLSYVDPTTQTEDLVSPPVEEIGDVLDFEARATTVLSEQNTVVLVRILPDPQLTAIYIREPCKYWGDPEGRLVMNWTNPVIRGLTQTLDDLVFARVIQLLFIQARMAGQHDTESDRRLLSTALNDLILIAVGAEHITPEEAEEKK